MNNPAHPDDPEVMDAINTLITRCGGYPEAFAGELIAQMIRNTLKLVGEKHELGQLKLMNRALKEMKYAYRIFNQHKSARCISIFGSARTPEHHPDYITAREFSKRLASLGWMCITGAANGIMKAGLEGLPRESSFGLSIRLPFEEPGHSLMEGDIKSIAFRYFFTRKLMFISHSDAVAAFPGGVGTLDELFEVLTLQQTGKANIVPIVLMEGPNGTYWTHWQQYVNKELLKNGWISQEDQKLYYIAKDIDDAIDHITKFYHRYHSSRYVKDRLVIRLQSPLSDLQVAQLTVKYKSIIASGEMELLSALPEESDHQELSRLVFQHTHKHFGLVRALIDDINDF
jgi:uncharacterized protein (TIGR00730 family)